MNRLIVLYTQGRHPKDIVRSYAHEMIHHIQNLEDRLGVITTTNTAEDDHLDGIEREAYEEGNIAFRNWTDSLHEGKVKDPFGLNAFGYEMARLGEEIIADEIKCDSCGWEWEIADGGNDLYICHKCRHDNTPQPLTEGRYDKLTNQLSRLAFELIKDGYNVGRKVVDETFTSRS